MCSVLGEGPCCVSEWASEWTNATACERLGRVGVMSSVHLKLKPVGFPFTNGTCWCYSWIPSCKPSWFWSSITPLPPFANHFPPLPFPSPTLRAIPSPHHAMWCSPSITYYSTRPALTLFSCLQMRRLPVNSPSTHDPPPSLTGCRGQAQIIKIIIMFFKMRKKKKKIKEIQTSDSQGVYVVYLTLWSHRTATQLSLKLFKEPKDNLPCMIAYQVFFKKKTTTTEWYAPS